MGFDLGVAHASIVIDASQVSAGIARAQADFRSGIASMGDSLRSFGDQISGIGRSLTTLTAPLMAIGGIALHSFMDFDEALTNIQAVTGATADEMQTLGDEILQIGEHSRAGPQAVAEAFYDIAGGVVDASSRMATLQAAVAAAEAGNADLGITTKALISIMNGYGFSADQAGYASDVLTRAVGLGVGTMDEFASALPNVAGMAANLGISFEDLGGMMAFITTKGVSANEAGTQLTSMMTALIKPTDDMSDALQSIGFSSGKAAIKQLGLVGTFKKLKDAGYDVETLGGRVEAMRGIIALTGDTAQEFLDNFSNGIDGLTEATRKIQDASPAAQLDFFNSAMQTLSITIGETLAPVLTRLLAQMLPIIDAIIAWVRENPDLVAQIGMIVTAAAALGAGLFVVGTAISAVGGIVTGLGVLLGVVLSPIGLVAAAVAGLYLAFQNNFMGIRDLVQPFIDHLTAGIDAIKVVLNGAIAFLNGETNVGGQVNLFNYVFGTDTQAGGIQYILERLGVSEETSKQVADVLRKIADAIRTGIDGIKLVITGNFKAGMFGGADEDSPVVSYFLSIHDKLKDLLDNKLTPLVSDIASELGKLDFTPRFKELQTQIDGIDFADMGKKFSDGFATIVINPDTQAYDFSGLQTFLTEHLSEVLDLALAGLALAFGGPLSIGIGLAKLLADAIANDFLGLGTFLKESGISDSVTKAFEDVKRLINDTLGQVFGGGGNTGLQGGDIAADLLGTINTEPIIAFGKTLSELINGALGGVKDIAAQIGPGLADLGKGIRGFLDAFAGTDTSGLDDLAVAIGAIFGELLKIGVAISSGVLSALGSALPPIGQALSSLVSALSAIGEGRWGDVLKNLGEGLLHLAEAATRLVVGIFDTPINFINALTGWNIPTFTDALNAVPAAFDSVKTAIEGFFAKIREGWDIFKTSIQPIIDLLTGLWAKVQGGVEAFKNGLKAAFDWITTNVLKPITDAIDSIKKAIDDITGRTRAADLEAQRVANAAYASSPDRMIPANPYYNPNAPGNYGPPIPLGPSRDSGGPGIAALPYLIGKPQEKKEVFVPTSNGEFFADFADKMAQAMGGMKGDGGVHITIEKIIANSQAEGAAAARGFKEELTELLGERG